MQQERQRIAVIGAGIAGLASAWLLARQHDVVLYEAGAYLGGHTNTVDVYLEGIVTPVDTGFLVFNENTYPNLIAMFAELGVASHATDMSFGVSMDNGRLEWAGANLDTVFAQRRNLVSPRFWSMLADILRFNRHASDYLVRYAGVSLGELLASERYGRAFSDDYLLPMAAAIWSSTAADILYYPASTFIRFCLNHSLLQVNDRPQWRTVTGGAREYVRKMAATLPDIRLRTPVETVVRSDEEALVVTASGTERFDAVVFGTHAPDTLNMLIDASTEEQRLLGAVRYQPNEAWLHTDVSLMPANPKVWSAWNYIGSTDQAGQRPVCVSYWLNRLQGLALDTPLMVTLNPPVSPAHDKIHGRFSYDHPLFDQAAIDAQTQLATIQGTRRCWFAGAWTGYGFHEDGLKSALRVARDFGVAPDWARP